MKFELLGYEINIKKESIEAGDEEEIKKALAVLEKHSINKQVSVLQAKSIGKATQVRQDRTKQKIKEAVKVPT